ncbi:MAG TPA: hypothetical protein VM219_09080 [Phycisphaerae bacterium]|nr:hypothetical protein [Phycisphaerae bacterium]HUX02979.1 hypothetical protein [Phycisphaerae bacterium]
MPITVSEKPDSRTRGEDRAEMRFIIRGTADGAAARTALLASGDVPAAYDGLVRERARVEPVHVDAGDEPACIWEGIVEYAQPSGSAPIQTEIGDVVLSVDTTGGTQHITQSLETLGYYSPPDKDPANNKGAIGVTDDSVEGVDIPLPVMRLTATKVWDPADESLPTIAALYALIDTPMNVAEFTVTDTQTGRTMTFAAGECRFLGHREGGRRADGGLEIVYEFDAQPNRTDMDIADMTDILGHKISKKGWDYLWFRYADAEDDAAKALVQIPIAAYVEKVHKDGDFSVLGL